MNPSAAGWIAKFLTQFNKTDLFDPFQGELDFYRQLRHTGFIYGVSVETLISSPVSSLDLTQVELAKLNLLHGLLHAYHTENTSGSPEEAIPTILAFYRHMEKGKTGLLKKLAASRKPTGQLETVFGTRLQENSILIHNRSTALLTYALLYVDILQFRVYLRDPDAVDDYAAELEHNILSVGLMALSSKKRKNKYDLQLLQLMEESSEYTLDPQDFTPASELTDLPFLAELGLVEKQYLLDMSLLAVWDDRELDADEFSFLEGLSALVGVDDTTLEESIGHLVTFSGKHAGKIALFNYAHPVQQFYKQSTETVRLLILRNRKRLARELNESGELVVLLGQSTVRELSREEKRKVRGQIFDLCKSIPSLAIFLLPGGTVLLPIFMKLVPQLLPSSFDENRIRKEAD
jgi:hypothetical protein